MARATRYPYTERIRDGWRASIVIDGRRLKGQIRYGTDARRLASEDAVLLRRQHEEAAARGETAPGATTLEEAFDRARAISQKRGVSEATLEHYVSHQAWWIRELGADARLDRLTLRDVQRIVDLCVERGDGPQTIRHRLTQLAAAAKHSGISPNPADRDRLVLPRLKKRDPALRLGWVEVLEILGDLACKGARDTFAVVALVAGTGVRRAEFARMRRRDLDVRGRRIIVPHGKTQPRELPMPTGTAIRNVVRDLLALRADGDPDEPILPGETERQRIDQLALHVKAARRLADEERIQLHELRRAFMSRVATAYPVPVAKHLAGQSLGGVEDRYVAADRKQLQAAMDDLWGDFEGWV